MFTAEAARISSPSEAGVRPKKRHNALPDGQYPISPGWRTSRAPVSKPASTGMEK
jgi:hypothetical protein